MDGDDVLNRVVTKGDDTVSLQSLNDILTQMQGVLAYLQGRVGAFEVRDDLTVKGNLSVDNPTDESEVAVYHHHTSDTEYDRLRVHWGSIDQSTLPFQQEARIISEHAGTGFTRSLVLGTQADTLNLASVILELVGAKRWLFFQNDFSPWTHNTNNIGGAFVRVHNFFSAGGVKVGLRLVATTSSTSSGDTVVLCDTSGAGFTLNLHAESEATELVGELLLVRNTGGNTVTIDPAAAATIDGAATFALTANRGAIIVRDASANWWVVAQF